MAVVLNPSTLLSGQGLDVASTVQQIINEQSGPLTQWQSQATTLATQSGLLLGINNNLTSLSTAVKALTSATGPLSAMAATSSSPATLTAIAQTTATTANHEITVAKLASQSLAYSNSVPNDSLSTGSLTLQVGNGAVKKVAITANETLEQLANSINNQNLGVTANVVNDADGSRLSLLSNTSGQPGTLTVGSIGGAGSAAYTGTGDGVIAGLTGGAASVAETYTITALDATNFSVTGSVSGALGTATVGIAFTSNQLGFTIAQGSTPFEAGDSFTVATTPPPLSFTQLAGINALLTVDGVPVNSASNTVTGVIPGVTLNLLGTSSGNPIGLTVGTDSAQVTNAINNFISAYNTLISSINQQYAVDPTTKTEGPLGSNISLRSLQSSLLNDASFSISGNSGLVNLASLGINMNNDGTLTLGLTPANQTMSQVLAANPSAFQNFFENTAGTGFANNFQSDLTHLTSPTQGVLNVDIAQNTVQQKALTEDIANFEAQLFAEQTQLTRQFQSVNASLQAYPLLLQEVTELIGSMNVSATTGQSWTPTLTSGL